MNKLSAFLLTAGVALASISYAADNQPPQRGPGGQPPSVDEAFAQMDSDGDNRLSESEVRGPLKNDFATVDSNSDGYISKDELENAPKPERGSQGRPPQPPES